MVLKKQSNLRHSEFSVKKSLNNAYQVKQNDSGDLSTKYVCVCVCSRVRAPYTHTSINECQNCVCEQFSCLHSRLILV